MAPVMSTSFSVSASCCGTPGVSSSALPSRMSVRRGGGSMCGALIRSCAPPSAVPPSCSHQYLRLRSSLSFATTTLNDALSSLECFARKP
eukprot:4660177-Prymnesium_polylepis.1